MLASFEIRNFKALATAKLDLRPVTVLIGQNGTGKSSVLQALILLKQSRGGSNLVVSSNFMNLGSYDEVLHMPKGGTQKDSQITFGLEASIPGLNLDRRPPIGPQPDINAKYAVIFGPLGLLSHSIEFAGDQFQLHGSWNAITGGTVQPPSIELQFTSGPGTVNLQLQSGLGQPVGVSGWSLPAGIQPLEQQSAQNELQVTLNGITQLLSQTYLVPPARGINSPSYPLSDSPNLDFLTTAGPEDYASRVLSAIAYRRELEESISQFSKRTLRVSMRVKLLPGKQVSAEAYNGRTRNLVNEGFGANQLMLLLAQAVIAEPGSILGIEEPEIHLHPQAQGKLAEIFVELIKGRENKQVIITTHSEHVLMGLLTQVARGALKPSEIAVHYFRRDSRGTARQQPLRVDDKGRLHGGLKGFFEANLDELERYFSALARH